MASVTEMVYTHVNCTSFAVALQQNRLMDSRGTPGRVTKVAVRLSTTSGIIGGWIHDIQVTVLRITSFEGTYRVSV